MSRVINKLYSTIGKRSTTQEKRDDMPLASKKKTSLTSDYETGTVGGAIATSRISLHCIPTREQVSNENNEIMDWTHGVDVPNQEHSSIKRNDLVNESNHSKQEGWKGAKLEAQSLKFDSFALCKVLYSRTYSTSTNTSYASTPEAKAKKRSLRRRRMSREGYMKKLKRTNDDEAFYTGDSELRKAVTKQYRYEDASKIAVELYSKESLPNCTRRYGTSPTSSCRSEGNFSQRGQLKLVICASEQRLTVTILEMKGLLQFSDKHSAVHVRMSLCPDDQGRERFKTSIKPVKSNGVIVHETFAFELTDDSRNRRLLVSAWQKFDRHDSSEFIGCMSFSVKKLKSNQRVVHGWYQLLGEMLGRRKHLAAKATTRNHLLENLDNSYPTTTGGYSSIVKGCVQIAKQAQRVQVQPLRDNEQRSNGKRKENSITEYYKNLFDTYYSFNETNMINYDVVPAEDKENSLNTHATQRVFKKKTSSIQGIREKSKTPIRRRQEDRSASKKRSPRYGGVRTPRRPRATRDASKSPALVVNSQVRSYRSKSARIVTRRRQTGSRTSTTRLLYSDITTDTNRATESSENIRPVSISSQDEIFDTAANLRIRDLNATIVAHDNLAAIEKPSVKSCTVNLDTKTETKKGEEKSINSMPALPVTMYENGVNAEADEDLINTCLTMTKTGRVRAKKQNFRKATYLNSQKTFSVEIDQLETNKLTEDAAASEKEDNNNSEELNDVGPGYWFKFSSVVDDDRGYTSDPEIDVDIKNVQIYRAWEKNNNSISMILSTPPPSVLHSTHCRLKRYAALDELSATRTELEMLKLNAISRSPCSIEAMARKRRRPSFLIAFLDPLDKIRKKKYGNMMEPLRPSAPNHPCVPLDLNPLLQDSGRNEDDENEAELEDVRKRKTTIGGGEFMMTKARAIFGSTMSLCSERSYRQKNAMMTTLRRINLSRKDTFRLHKFEEADEQRNSLLSVAEEPTLKNDDFANGNKIIRNSYTELQRQRANEGVYVELAKADKKQETESEACKENIPVEIEAPDNNTANAKGTLGTLMTWLQRKSPESPSSSRRRSSISRKSTSRTSMRSRSSTRHENKTPPTVIEADGGSVTLQRKPRAVTKDTAELCKSFEYNDITKPAAFTLEEMLRNRVATQVFRDFLKSEYSEENLDFWLDCAAYRTQKPSKQAKLALKIFNQYLTSSAPREVNIDFETRARTEEKLNKHDKDIFTEPQNCIYSLMKCDSFRRFQQSDSFLKIQDYFLEDLYKNQLVREGKSGGIKRSFKSSSKKKKSPR